MKKISRILFIVLIIIVGWCIYNLYSENRAKQAEELADENLLQSGDIIFQTSLSAQSQAIQDATNSKYSHCGIIFKQNEQLFVFEAVQPVKKTPIKEWIQRGKNGHFVVKRLKNSDEILTQPKLQKMKEIGLGFQGKNYDLSLEWSDKNIYCSGLVWKIYQRATNLEIGKLRTLSEFDLSGKVVKSKLKERYGDHIPLNETVISPASIFKSKLLETIIEN